MEESIRINKYLSECGVCSRREADRLIEAGKVKIDGCIATTGDRVMPGQEVYVQDKLISLNKKKIVIAYNKPIGIECTSDPKNPDNIIKAVNFPERLYTVGRLDKNSCGLILLTNDGELCNLITKANGMHQKEYYVKVNKDIDKEFVRNMEEGVFILDKKTAPCKLKVLNDRAFTITLIQGLNRQIRRMCEALDRKVVYLKRVRIENINLSTLVEGKYRYLSDEELRELYRRIGKK